MPTKPEIGRTATEQSTEWKYRKPVLNTLKAGIISLVAIVPPTAVVATEAALFSSTQADHETVLVQKENALLDAWKTYDYTASTSVADEPCESPANHPCYVDHDPAGAIELSRSQVESAAAEEAKARDDVITDNSDTNKVEILLAEGITAVAFGLGGLHAAAKANGALERKWRLGKNGQA